MARLAALPTRLLIAQPAPPAPRDKRDPGLPAKE